ncbi:MAG TPA: hypothetical protein VMU78_01535 [Methylocella sp.]|nr:hypothetical protein [Methylocella sp.]
MSSEDKTRSVRAILFEDWDPVGFGPLLPADEYDAYILGIMQLLGNHCSAEELEAHLVKIEKERFGAAQESGKARVSAKNLVASWSAND